MEIFLFILSTLGAFGQIKALTCWECENVFSDEECLEKGSLKTCRPNQNSCQIELRRGGWGTSLLITKRCKQAWACYNNYIQNSGQAWNKVQCNLRSPSGVCRCCCKTDACNKQGFECWDEAHVSCLPLYKSPQGGSVECSDENNVGSRCTFTCDAGYTLTGTSTSTCLPSGRWSNGAPSCRKNVVLCLPRLESPTNGNIMCSNANLGESICRFTCDPGYTLGGAPESTCNFDSSSQNDAGWSSQPPICTAIISPSSCVEEQRNPVNGIVSCSDGSNAGSVCTFVCNQSFMLIGKETTTCHDENGSSEWLHAAPTCQVIVDASCAVIQSNPSNGLVSCTHDKHVGSVCSFECNNGFTLIGHEITTCADEDGTAMWKYEAPVCEAIIFPSSCVEEQRNPVNGIVSCSDGSNAGSVCTFVCNQGFMLIGKETSTCHGENGSSEWLHAAPTCQVIVDASCAVIQSNPSNGLVSCTHDKHVGSVCSFECNNGFTLIGHEITTCTDEDGTAMWKYESPVCEEIRCLPIFEAPINGAVSCSDENKEESKCQFVCDQGFHLLGSSSAVCLPSDNGTWSQLPPVCQEIACTPEQNNPINGVVICNDDNKAGSECEFACDIGFDLVGPLLTTCEIGEDFIGIWSHPAPICIEMLCFPLPNAPNNGTVSCTNNNKLNSECQFSCDEGYKIVGPTLTICSANDTAIAIWSQQSPICKGIEMECDPAYVTLMNGAVTCTNSNSLGSICTFVCDDKFALVGEQDLVCLKQDGSSSSPMWSDSSPACQRKLCPNAPDAPLNGKVTCSDESFLGSKCSFTCDSQYLLGGSTETICVENGDGSIMWDRMTPTCEEMTCNPAYVDFEHGVVTCTNSNSLGSMCTFVCDDQFTLLGEQELVCQEQDGSSSSLMWSNSPPTCQKKLCPNAPDAPMNGRVTCSDESFLASKCSFTCDSQYLLRGNIETICVENADGSIMWDRVTPTCEEMTCNPVYVDFEHGVVTCTNNNSLGSMCTFVCDDQFALVGEQYLVCLMYQDGSSSSPMWTDSSPTCQRKLCPNAPDAPMNGKVTCSDESFLGSKCSFTCGSEYLLRGDTETICVEKADGSIMWDKMAPTCEATGCKSQLSFPHGRALCTKDGLPSSTCTFECTETDYHVYPETFVENTCMDNDQWDVPTPCCARDCPPDAVMDFIVVLDSSSSVGGSNWDKMMSFVDGVLRKFTLSPEAAAYGIFRYNREVDTETQILLNDFLNNKEDLLDAFARIPYNGMGTHTGNAISHVTDVMLAPSNGNREKVADIVLIITDGRSQDQVGEPARRLRESGATVYVLPINPPTGSLDMEQVEEIVSDKRYIFDDALVEGFEALTDEFASRIAMLICGNPCDHVLHEHE